MRWWALWILAFIWMGAASPTSQRNDFTTASAVTGKVVTPDGKPAAKVTVWLVVNRWEVGRMTVESTGLTDAQGNFKLPFKPPLRVFSAYVVAHHPNFAVGWQSFDPRDLKPLKVWLRTSAPLTGTLVTPDGKPLAGAKLQVCEIESVRSRLAFEVSERESGPSVFNISGEMPEEVSPFWTVTDSQGRFAFLNLPENSQISLRVHHPDYAPSRLPSPSDWFPLRTGMTEVTLVAIPKSFLKGQVLRDGKPVENADVVCQTKFYGEREYRATTDADGKFEISFHGGYWLVYASAEDGKWQSEPQVVSVAPGQFVSVTLNLQKAVEIKGTVKDTETKKPVPFAEVYGYRQILMEVQRQFPFQTWWRPKVVKADESGKFSLFLLPGKWTVRAWASYSPEHFADTVKEVEVKGESVELPDLLLQSPPKVIIQVVNESGKPVPKAIISSGQWILGQANEKGFAQIGYAPQIIWAASPDLTMFGKTDYKPGTKSVRIVLQKGVPVSGRVTDENGKPVPNARLRAEVIQREPGVPFEIEIPSGWFEVVTDKQGRFRFHLPSGLKFRLVALAEGFFPTLTEPHTTEGKQVTMTVKMKRPNLTLEGKVVDEETGQPIRGAAIEVFMGFPRGSSPEWGIRVAFTDEQGQFRLTDLHKEHLWEITAHHPLYQALTLRWEPIGEQSLTLRLERIRPHIPAQLTIGKPAPPLSDVEWLDGKVPLLQGKTTYLLFAMPYDPSCERVMKRLREMQMKEPDKTQVIIVFDASLPNDELRRYVQELNLPFHFGVVPEERLCGWDSETFQSYGVKEVPMLVVIDEHGIVNAINPE